jgi:hypothetical protein
MKLSFRSFRTLVLLTLVLPGLPALAQVRSIPLDVARGYVQHVQEMVIAIDGKPLILSPSATIRDQNNLIIVPMALPQNGTLAEYQLGIDGQVQRVWLLTPDEAARPVPRRP